MQERTAILPDYGFRERSGPAGPPGAAPGAVRWPAVNAGASVSGLVGGALTLLLAGAVGSALRRIRRA